MSARRKLIWQIVGMAGGGLAVLALGYVLYRLTEPDPGRLREAQMRGSIDPEKRAEELRKKFSEEDHQVTLPLLAVPWKRPIGEERVELAQAALVWKRPLVGETAELPAALLPWRRRAGGAASEIAAANLPAFRNRPNPDHPLPAELTFAAVPVLRRAAYPVPAAVPSSALPWVNNNIGAAPAQLPIASVPPMQPPGSVKVEIQGGQVPWQRQVSAPARVEILEARVPPLPPPATGPARASP